MKHLAIIMDGNRRWAKDQWLPWYKWHSAWAKNAISIVKAANEKDIEVLTLWGLSTENLKKRTATEVGELIKILIWAKQYLPEIHKYNGKIELIGDTEKLPYVARKTLEYMVKDTAKNTGITIVLALVYGWQNEIIRGIKKAVKSWIDIETLDENSFLDFIDTWKYSPPDLIIRTWWDIRHSWFMLYRSDYSEYYFTQKKWPEFDSKELDTAIQSFTGSKRNFWK